MPKPTVTKPTGAAVQFAPPQRTIKNSLLVWGLTGKFPLPDPIEGATRRALDPGGLLGKLPPSCISQVELFMAKPKSEWTDSDYRRAADFLGYWVDALRERSELQHLLLVAENAPKKRGRKRTKITNVVGGLLSVPAPAAPKGGRPTIWNREFQEALIVRIDAIKRKHALKHDSKAIQKLIEEWAAEAGITTRALKSRHLSEHEVSLDGTLRNLVSKSRKILSKPPS